LKKLTPEDKMDNLLCSVTLEQAESMLERAKLVVGIRRKEAERIAAAKKEQPAK
jgi:hypothetical protein